MSVFLVALSCVYPSNNSIYWPVFKRGREKYSVYSDLHSTSIVLSTITANFLLQPVCDTIIISMCENCPNWNHKPFHCIIVIIICSCCNTRITVL